jgi:MarR family transcriptional regulator, organic hydroperoxide resistance regulator
MRPAAEIPLQSRPALPPVGDALGFLRLVWALDHSLQRASKRMFASTGVTGPQRLVIRIVGRFPGILAVQLADILHVHPSTLSSILARLTGQGLITRRPDPKDRRRMQLGLTSAGRAIDVGSAHTIEGAVERALERLPAEKVRHAADVLAELVRSLEETRRAQSPAGAAP